MPLRQIYKMKLSVVTEKIWSPAVKVFFLLGLVPLKPHLPEDRRFSTRARAGGCEEL